MSVQLFNPLHIFALIRQEFRDLVWKYDDYLNAKERFPAHQKAMREGYNSPYSHPKEYYDNWVPRRKTVIK